MPTRSIPSIAGSRVFPLAIAIIAGACTAGGGATSAPGTAAPPAAATSTSGASAATGMMASGQFHDVDGTAMGEAQIVVKPDGTYAVVLEQFKTGSIDHTNIALVQNADVKATADVDKSKLLDLGPLKSTEGMQDFPIPADMASNVMTGYHTVLLWDTAMAHAVAAAPLS